MRKKIIIGNWKLNKTQKESLEFLKELKKLKVNSDIEFGVAPTFTSLSVVDSKRVKGLKLAAQNVSNKDNGAFTGEVSIDMLKENNVEYVILGHSERREIFKEDDTLINSKTKHTLENGLKPILCVGESLKEREANKTAAVVTKQLKADLKDIDANNAKKMVIAYEPIWAIGTGKTATAQQAQEVCKLIRDQIEKMYDKNTADTIRIQYGGSVKPENVKEILVQNDIDGALVGGASLDAKSFSKLLV